MKNPVTPPGIDPGTNRLVSQRFNHYATPGPILLYYNIIILWDHRHLCRPSLTETSLCGAYLYLKLSPSISVCLLSSLAYFSPYLFFSLVFVFPIEERAVLVLLSVTDYPVVPFPIFVTSCPIRLSFSL